MAFKDMFDVFIERPSATDGAACRNLAHAVGRRFGMDPKNLAELLYQGAVRVRSDATESSASHLKSSLEQLGAHVLLRKTQKQVARASGNITLPGAAGADFIGQA